MPTSESAPSSGDAGSAAKSAPERPQRPRHWRAIGIEMEGAWKEDPRRFLLASPLVDVKDDSSVRVRGGVNKEVTLGPYRNLRAALAMVRKCHPTATNSTCGLHVHLSFSDEDTKRLAAPEFWDANEGHWSRFWREWGEGRGWPQGHPFWRRLNGRNRYCEPRRKEDLSSYYNWYYQRTAHRTAFQQNRYSAVNFTAYQEHGTIEQRVLPMFSDPDITCAAIRATVECFDSYLAAGPPIPNIAVPRAYSSVVDFKRRVAEKRRRYRAELKGVRVERDEEVPF